MRSTVFVPSRVFGRKPSSRTVARAVTAPTIPSIATHTPAPARAIEPVRATRVDTRHTRLPSSIPAAAIQGWTADGRLGAIPGVPAAVLTLVDLTMPDATVETSSEPGETACPVLPRR